MQIRLSGILCQATGGALTVEVSGATIGDILTSLVEKHPAIQEHRMTGSPWLLTVRFTAIAETKSSRKDRKCFCYLGSKVAKGSSIGSRCF